ncbi:MAG: P1 family peptidase [Roseiflexaceae bacterium]|nr:P1 family peptidase [Roseiflexaceae bacterium]
MARGRDIGIALDGTPGPLNAITDITGVEVGHTTILRGNGPLNVSEGPVRTGVTAVLPRGKSFAPVFAAGFSLNGNGEMTGMHWVEESGFLESPIMLTNTHSVGTVRDTTIAWLNGHGLYSPIEADIFWHMPVVAETYDGVLSDINGFHVRPGHVVSALNKAVGGPVAEGSVGSGTGMICHGFKGGIGTASRIMEIDGQLLTLGAFVQANHGKRADLTITGIPIGREIDAPHNLFNRNPTRETGSIIVIVATDAPLLPHQLKRLARRVPIGIGRVGAYGGNSSGDLFIAFSTANQQAFRRSGTAQATFIPNDELDQLFEAVVQSVEEAILNALIAATDMTGRDGNTVYALPHDKVRVLLQKYRRL